AIYPGAASAARWPDRPGFFPARCCRDAFRRLSARRPEELQTAVMRRWQAAGDALAMPYRRAICVGWVKSSRPTGGSRRLDPPYRAAAGFKRLSLLPRFLEHLLPPGAEFLQRAI